MTREELFQLQATMGIEEAEIMRKKNADYAGDDPDPFRNFRMFGALGVLVRMSDKLARLRTFIEKGSYQVADETVNDTIGDLRNYGVILRGIFSEKH